MREVWITGMGAISAAGSGAESFASLLTEGRSAVAQGETGWSGTASFDSKGKEARRLDRCARLFLAAAREAWDGAGLATAPPLDSRRTGVVEGSSVGAMGEVIRESRLGDGARRSRRLIRFMPGAGGATLAQDRGIGGPVLHLSAGSVSATIAIGEAFLMIATGRIDLGVAGGAEAPLYQDITSTFREAGILSEDAEWPCRPFDVRRSGTVLGEGAGAVILESADHARKRGAAPIAVLRGYAITTESCGMVAADASGAGVASAVSQALRQAQAGEPAWIKAHGTGTVSNDLAECGGLLEVLGPALARIPITSLKPTFGHALGASGALELVAVLLALRERIIPATVGTETVDPALPSCDVVTRPRERVSGNVLLMSESFGGRSAALVVG
jgi:nodulation protein E